MRIAALWVAAMHVLNGPPESQEVMLSTKKSLQCCFHVLLLIWNCRYNSVQANFFSNSHCLQLTVASTLFQLLFSHTSCSLSLMDNDGLWNPLKFKTDKTENTWRLARWMREVSVLKSVGFSHCERLSFYWLLICLFTYNKSKVWWDSNDPVFQKVTCLYHWISNKSGLQRAMIPIQKKNEISQRICSTSPSDPSVSK